LSEPAAVVIPSYNASRTVGPVVRRIPAFVRHIVVVDDGSADDTAEILAALDEPRLVVLRHAVNRGVGAAIVSGYREALRLGAGIVAVMGADDQMDPDELADLVAPVAAGETDYAKGNRFLAGLAFGEMPFVRWVGNVMLSWLSKPATGYWGVFDSQCGYTAISARALRRLPLDDIYPRYGFPNDMLLRLNLMGATVAERPVTPIYHPHRSHLRVWLVAGPLAWLLARLFVRRLAHRLRAATGARGEVADAG